MSADLSEVFRTERAAQRALREYVDSELWKHISGKPLFKVLLDRVAAYRLIDKQWDEVFARMATHCAERFNEGKKK